MGLFNLFKRQDKVIETADSQETISSVLDRMSSSNIGCMVITEEDKVVGIFSERDLLRRWKEIYPLIISDVKISKVMTKNVKTLDYDKIEKASVTMMAHKFRHLPITKDGKLIDIISIRDVVNSLFEEIDDLNRD